MNYENAYQETLDYLYRFIDTSLTHAFRYSAEKFNLNRMVDFLGRLGNPHQQYPAIHVAGTKGKGSVSSLVARSLQEAGYRTGLYTSPHLLDYTERIQIDGIQISHAELVKLVDELRPVIESFPGLTTFEITTALGFLDFARQKVDVAVVEVGLGGRLDATNVIQPLVSVITSLSMDHTEILGDTLEKIAAEKAGIIKTGIPVVSAPQKKEARQVLQAVSRERNAPLSFVGQDLLYRSVSHDLHGQEMEFWAASEQEQMDRYLENGDSGDWKPRRLSTRLLGHHQVINAATAYLAIQQGNQAGLQVSEPAIKAGFERVVWPGRFEVLGDAPAVVIDSAHNEDSALRLCQALDDYFPGKPVILVFGASEDKDVEGMFTEIIPRVERVIATQSDHPRALEAERIVELAHRMGCPAQGITPLEKAVRQAVHLAGSEKIILITGSLFVASAAREIWINKFSDKLDPGRTGQQVDPLK